MNRILIVFTLCFGCPAWIDAQSIPVLEARALPVGTVVTVQGTVTNGPELGTIRYLQDATAGIAAYPGTGSASGFAASAGPGDSILISGKLTDFNGLLEINPVLSYQVMAKNRPLPAPKQVAVAELGENLESQLIRVDCIRFDGAGMLFSGNNTFRIHDPAGDSAEIYLNNSHPVAGSPIPAGPVQLTAILSRYNGYQLLPRNAADFTNAVCFYLTGRPEQSNIHTTGFRVSWKTNLSATAYLLYGASPDDLPGALAVPAEATEHTVGLTGLLPGAVYWVRIIAVHNADTTYSPLVPFATQSLSSGRIKVYFNHSIDPVTADGQLPDGTTFTATLAETIARIDSAVQTLDVAMYNNNRSDITEAIVRAYQRGVRVRYIAADATGNQALSPMPGFPVVYGNTNALMHNKFMVIDASLAEKAWVMSGSMNWTTANMVQDYNNLLFIQDQSLARAYELEFNEMWGSATAIPNLSNSRFGAMKQDNTPHRFIIGGRPVECWFSPSDQVTARIVEAVGTADAQASFEVFSFTKDEIGNALIAAHEKGIPVQGIMENIHDQGAEIDRLVNAGVSVFPHPGGGLMHHKYLVVDAAAPASDPLVLTGSHNWTQSAETANDENTLVLHDPALATLFQAEFAQRWTETTTKTTAPQASEIRLFPNPARQYLYIQAGNGFLPAGTISIWDACGRHYLTQTLTTGVTRATIALGDLPSGFYVAKIQTDRGISTFPFQALSR